MMRRISIFFLIFLMQSLLYAGNTGKILGRVVDKNSGEPLVGVNIVLVDQFLGASTDANGEYFIINVKPGVYTLECSYVGYQTIRVENVAVQSDQSTRQDFELFEQVMESNEKIVVTAKKPLVRKDLTSSRKVTTTEEIKALPVETFSGIMLSQAGVTEGANGALHIRGGRSTEIAYLVDGVSVANPFSTNGLATSVSNNSIQELTVVSGAFNAEYGNAMSGVVNFTTKDGGPVIKSFLSFYAGDYISSHDNIFTNIKDINPVANRVAEGTLSGPLSFIGKNNTFFVSVRSNNSDGYLYGIREHLPSDSANFEPKKYVTTEKDEDKITTIITYKDEWYIENGGDNKVIPMNPSKSLNLLGKLKFQLAPNMVLRLQNLYNFSRNKSYVHAYKYNPDGTYNYLSNSSNTSLQFTHTLSNSTFYEVKAAYNNRNYEQYVFKNYKDPRYVPTNLVRGTPPSTTFRFSGDQMGQVYEKSNTFIGKVDLTSQVNNNNLVKAGVEARLYTLNRDNFTIGYDRNVYRTPTKVNEAKYIRHPQQISVYLQDKLEYKDMIINAGLRYDYFNSHADYAVDELQPDGKRARASAKNMFAPRLGISFPITAQGIIHLSYGHFYQMPSLRNLYLNPDFLLTVGGTPLFGNANLNPEKTISYEIGLQQQLGSSIAMDITGFYKDIRDLLAWQTITFDRLDGDRQNYRVRRNQDYGNIKGITLSIEKRRTNSEKFSAKIDYTFQVAEGNDNNAAAFYYNALSGQENIKERIPLDWDQTHNLYVSFAINPIDALSISMIGKLSSGYPYTPYIPTSNYDSKPNSDRKPVQKTVDLQAGYRFAFSNVHYRFFVKVYNLFDALNERYVFNDTGRASYTFANRSASETEAFTKHYGEPGVHTYNEYNIRPDYYRSPRQVRVGLSLEF